MTAVRSNVLWLVMAVAFATGCSLVGAIDAGSATWRLANGQANLPPDTTQLSVLITEGACASGKSPEGRVLPPAISYGADRITITISITTLPGSQTCQGNPEYPMTIHLQEPTAGRLLVDGNGPPGRGSPRADLATPTPNPYAGLPSNACGGFHLKIVNNSPGAVTVTLNGGWSIDIAAGSTKVVNYAFTEPQPPELPWTVVITDSTGVQLFAATMDTPVDQKVTLVDNGAVQTPYSLTDEGC